jgi:hypothetical protein
LTRATVRSRHRPSSHHERAAPYSPGLNISNNHQQLLDNAHDTTVVVMPSIDLFIGINSLSSSSSYRNAQRETWLKWAVDSDAVDYRFFFIPPQLESEGTPLNYTELDVVTVPSEAVFKCKLSSMSGMGDQRHHCRSGVTVWYMLQWALLMTRAQFVLATEHDGFVCLVHLLQQLPNLTPKSWLAHWYFEEDPYPVLKKGECPKAISGAEQTFDLYGRELVSRILNLIDDGWVCTLPYFSWNQNTRPIVQYLWELGEVDIVADQNRVVSSASVSKIRARTDSHKCKSNLALTCLCGTLYYHLRSDAARSMSRMFGTLDDHNARNASMYPQVPLTPLPKSCLPGLCPQAASSNDTLPRREAWWQCPAYSADRFGVIKKGFKRPCTPP